MKAAHMARALRAADTFRKSLVGQISLDLVDVKAEAVPALVEFLNTAISREKTGLSRAKEETERRYGRALHRTETKVL